MAVLDEVNQLDELLTLRAPLRPTYLHFKRHVATSSCLRLGKRAA
jgi:hypothetical protein